MDLFSEAMRRDPYPVYDRIRAVSPVLHDPATGKRKSRRGGGRKDCREVEMRKRFLFLVLWLGVALVPGCRPPVQRMEFAIGQKGGCATLLLGDTTIIFDGIPVQGGDVEKKMVGSLMVGGSGVGEVTSSIDGLELRYTYAKGQGRFTFGEYTFRLTDEGARLVFGETRFPVGEKTIRVARDGRARSE